MPPGAAQNTTFVAFGASGESLVLGLTPRARRDSWRASDLGVFGVSGASAIDSGMGGLVDCKGLELVHAGIILRDAKHKGV